MRPDPAGSGERGGESAYLPYGLAVVHPWLCDRMGHLTTRHYMGLFDDASYQLFAALDPEADTGPDAARGWADTATRSPI